jgi:hypothetical protein
MLTETSQTKADSVMSLYEISGTGGFEETGSGTVCQVLERENVLLMEKVWKQRTVMVTTVWMHVAPPNCTPKNGSSGKFCHLHLTTAKEKHLTLSYTVIYPKD